MKFVKYIQEITNRINRRRLRNTGFTIISSNCAGGFLYHWLHQRFDSPFINLYMSNEDFLIALSDLEKFINTPIKEFKNKEYKYPVGIGYGNTLIHFMHYDSFDEANEKWKERCERINWNNLFVMLTNWEGNEDILYKFDDLPYKHKVVFTNRKYDGVKSACYLRGFERNNGVGQVYRTMNIFGKRYIDQFDYIGFFNDDLSL